MRLGWSISAIDVQLVNSPKLCSLFQPCSPPLVLPDARQDLERVEDTPAPSQLPLFQSHVLQAVALGRGPSAEAPAAKRAKHVAQPEHAQAAVDVLLYTGGLVWCSAWCPHLPLSASQAAGQTSLGSGQSRQGQVQVQGQGTPGTRPTAASAPEDPGAAGSAAEADWQQRWEVLALGVHPAKHTRHKQGVAVSGPGAVQLWGLPCAGQPGGEGQQGAPYLAAALVHSGRVAWELQWCPEPGLVLAPQPDLPLPLPLPLTSTELPANGVGPAHEQAAGQAQAPPPAAPGPLPDPRRLASMDLPVDPRRPASSQLPTDPRRAASAQLPTDPRLPAPGLGSSSRQPPAAEPLPLPPNTQLPAVGVLAMVLGDGCVQVVVVPSLPCLHQLNSYWKQQQQQGEGEGERLGERQAPRAVLGAVGEGLQQPESAGGAAAAAGGVAAAQGASAAALALQVAPVAVIRQSSLGGAAASTVAWRPGLPGGLLVGCWDGSVSCWLLPGPATRPWQRLQCTAAVRADSLPLRRVLAHPPCQPPPGVRVPGAGAAVGGGKGREKVSAGAAGAGAGASGVGGAGPGCSPQQQPGLSQVWSLDNVPQHLFTTVAQSGSVRVWDDRDLVFSVMDKLVSRVVTYDAVWVAGPPPQRHTILLAMEDGSIRALELAPAHYAVDASNALTSVMQGLDTSCCWSVSYSPALGLVAAAGDEGLVSLVAVECVADNRQRRPHVPLAGMISEGGQVLLLGPRQLAGVPCVYAGGAAYGGQGDRKSAAAQKAIGSGSLRDCLQTLYTVAWSPNVTGCAPVTSPALDSHSVPGGSAWLAFGGMSGLVRCMRVGMQAD